MSDYMQRRLLQKQFGKIPEDKKPKGIAKVSEKKKAEIKAQKESGSDSVMEYFFNDCRKRMVGKCFFCGGATEKDNDETFKRSIAHILPKRKNMFPSIASHPMNWIELCFHGNSCHTNFDNGIITWEFLKDSKEWEEIVRRFKMFYPYITENEKKNIPPLLLNELK